MLTPIPGSSLSLLLLTVSFLSNWSLFSCLFVCLIILLYAKCCRWYIAEALDYVIFLKRLLNFVLAQSKITKQDSCSLLGFCFPAPWLGDNFKSFSPIIECSLCLTPYKAAERTEIGEGNCIVIPERQ